MRTCITCEHLCHCMLPADEHQIVTGCDCENCECDGEEWKN